MHRDPVVVGASAGGVEALHHVLFRSAVIGVVLSGALDDGTAGTAAIKTRADHGEAQPASGADVPRKHLLRGGMCEEIGACS